MSKSTMFVLSVMVSGSLFPGCGEDKGDSPLPSEGEVGPPAGGEGEGEGPGGEGEGEGPESGEGEGPVCACTVNADCDDGNFCNGAEVCANCACEPGLPPTCADEFECTEDRCANNTCVNVPAHARCGAGKICRPAEGGCVAPPPCRDDADCVPDDPCQVGACDEATRSCAFAPFDGDEDGHPPIICGGDDCDDSSGTVNPDREERCNDKDDNCDGEVDEEFDLLTDSYNCGGCNNECSPGQQCQNGTCQCLEGLTFCGQNVGCLNTQTNRANCGQCNNPCWEGLWCITGQCACLDGLVDCGNGCTDTQTDRENCGGCSWADGHRCPDGLICSGGECGCGEEGIEPCNGWCTRVVDDPDNCGQCGNWCGEGATCRAGQCVCQNGNLTACPGVGCVNLQDDPERCGACDRSCDIVANEACLDGACRCWEGEDRCDGICTDVFFDSFNCGRCGNECPFGSECQNGECGDCEQEWRTGRQCNGDCVVCDGYCSLTATDAMNCGRCGNQCGVLGSECYDGRCVCAWTWNDVRCGNGDCIVCNGMADLAGVDSVCVHPAADVMNCGQCGNRCVPPARCSQWGCQ